MGGWKVLIMWEDSGVDINKDRRLEGLVVIVINAKWLGKTIGFWFEDENDNKRKNYKTIRDAAPPPNKQKKIQDFSLKSLGLLTPTHRLETIPKKIYLWAASLTW